MREARGLLVAPPLCQYFTKKLPKYCNDTPEHIEMFYQFHKQGFCSLFLDTGDK